MKTDLRVKGSDFERAAEGALRAVLGEVPFARVVGMRSEAAVDGEAVDLLVQIAIGRQRWRWVCEFKRSAQPALVRPAIEQLRRGVKRLGPRAYGVFIAPYVSPRAARICREAGVGYLDLAGNSHLSFGQVYIHTVGERNSAQARREGRSLFSPKAARALRVLLTPPRRPWKVQDLAAEANISLGLASNVKRMLADREWLGSGADGVLLTDPESVLVDWTQNQPPHEGHARDFYSLKRTAEVESELAAVCGRCDVRYALTGFSAGLRLAPMVRNQRLTAYVSEIREELISRLGLRPVESGANVTLIVPADDGVFYGANKIDGVMTVSPVQAYLDLKRMGGRGQEAADAILEHKLRPLW